MADGVAGEAGELGGVGQAPGQGVLGHLLAGVVAGGLPGELLGAGQAGGAITPGRPCRVALGGPAGALFGQAGEL